MDVSHHRVLLMKRLPPKLVLLSIFFIRTHPGRILRMDPLKVVVVVHLLGRRY